MPTNTPSPLAPPTAVSVPSAAHPRIGTAQPLARRVDTPPSAWATQPHSISPLPPIASNRQAWADTALVAPAEEAPRLAPAAAPAEVATQTFAPTAYQRSWGLELIARQADEHTQRGFELASRKAFFSARLEMTRALRLLAQGLDTQRQSSGHSRALAEGLRAMEEADDFAPRPGRLEAELDLQAIIATHHTPVLQDAAPGAMTPLSAMQRYYDHARDRLAVAAGKELAGSMALLGLGKLYVVMGNQHVEGITSAHPKAMTLLQAALLVSPGNHMASNELGVLLAKNSRDQEAAAAFHHSLSLHSTEQGWRNLALTYERLGQMEAAYQAARNSLALRNQSADGGRVVDRRGQTAVRWVAPAEFAARDGYGRHPNGPMTATRQGMSRQ